MFSVKQVAEKLGISESTVRNLIRDGDLEHHRVRSLIRVSQSQLDKYIEGSLGETVVVGAIKPTKKYF